MTRLEQWKAKLKTAKAELPMLKRQHNITERSLARCLITIHKLEKQIGRNVANTARKARAVKRG